MVANLIETTIVSRYDVTAMVASPLTILWTADYLVSAGYEIDQIKKDLKKVNRKREKAGKIPAYAPYGSPLF